MAVTVLGTQTTDEDDFAALRYKVIDLGFGGQNYPAGGFTGIRAAVGFSQVLWSIVPIMRIDAVGGVPFIAYDLQADALHMYVSGASGTWPTEYTTGSAMGTLSLRFFCIGK